MEWQYYLILALCIILTIVVVFGLDFIKYQAKSYDSLHSENQQLKKRVKTITTLEKELQILKDTYDNENH